MISNTSLKHLASPPIIVGNHVDATISLLRLNVEEHFSRAVHVDQIFEGKYSLLSIFLSRLWNQRALCVVYILL